MEKQKKDQFVIANLADLDHTEAVVDYSIHLASRLSKGLILLHIVDKRYPSPSQSDAEASLRQIQQTLSESSPSVQISYAVLSGSTREVVESLPTVLNGVVAVTASSLSSDRHSPLHPKNILHDFSNSKIAFLVARDGLPFEPIQEVSLSIDFHRESKEKLIWSSYFSRFGGSSLHVLYHDYKDEGLRQKWYNNMLFLHKFFTNLGLTFTPHIVPGKAAAVDADSLTFMGQGSHQLLVAVTTKEKDLFDSLLGPQEQRTIKNAAGIPILFLNPRDDLYVLCD